MEIKIDEKYFKTVKFKLENDLKELKYSIKENFYELKRAISKGDFGIAITICEDLIESLKEAEVKESFLNDLEEMVMEDEM